MRLVPHRHGVGLLFAARALQGVAVGLISGAASAALLDLRPHGGAAPVVSSAAPTGGQALGAIGASVLAQYAPAPTHLVWWLLLGAFIIGVVAVLAMPEPGTVRPGVVSSLRPHVSVPRAARGAFATAVPALVGIWALAGFVLSLGPSLAAQLLHSKNLLWGGILIFLLTGLGAAASALLARKNPSVVMLGGCLLLIIGALVTFASIETGTAAALFVGTAIAGLGFGPAFMGAYRATVAAATSYDRAGLITAIYIVSYLATGIPAVLAGIATSHYGLHMTALVYSVAVAVLAAVAGNLAAPVADDYLDSCLATCRVARSRISSVRLKRRAAASSHSALDWNHVTVHPYTCAAVELRHGPLTMAAAKTWLAAERRAIERIKRQATPMPIVAATRHRSPTRSRRNRTTSRIPSWTARP